MKKKDLILIATVFIIALASFVAIQLFERFSTLEDGVAVVSYRGGEILEIDLRDGSFTLIDDTRFIGYCETVETDSDVCRGDQTYLVQGELGIVHIQYIDHQVQVIHEISPQNICQLQGKTNSPLRPLTCLPNHVVITIESGVFDPDEDDVIIE